MLIHRDDRLQESQRKICILGLIDQPVTVFLDTSSLLPLLLPRLNKIIHQQKNWSQYTFSSYFLTHRLLFFNTPYLPTPENNIFKKVDLFSTVCSSFYRIFIFIKMNVYFFSIIKSSAPDCKDIQFPLKVFSFLSFSNDFYFNISLFISPQSLCCGRRIGNILTRFQI